MQARFRGVRGSVPWSAPDAAVYGCNTPCVEIVDDRTASALVLDAGSGIVGAGALPGASRIALLLTHYHWDHVLGLPFFTPLYQAGREVSVHTPMIASGGDRWLESVFNPAFFPVPYTELPNPPRIEQFQSGDLNGFDVRALPLNHPGGALAYRIRGSAGDLVYATDHEFGDPRFDEPLTAFVRGARDVIFDAHFTPDERPRHRGWGHSDWRECAECAARAGVGRLWLFHHKPGRTDEDIKAIAMKAREVFQQTEAAKEGAVIEF